MLSDQVARWSNDVLDEFTDASLHKTQVCLQFLTSVSHRNRSDRLTVVNEALAVAQNLLQGVSNQPQASLSAAVKDMKEFRVKQLEDRNAVLTAELSALRLENAELRRQRTAPLSSSTAVISLRKKEPIPPPVKQSRGSTSSEVPQQQIIPQLLPHLNTVVDRLEHGNDVSTHDTPAAADVPSSLSVELHSDQATKKISNSFTQTGPMFHTFWAALFVEQEQTRCDIVQQFYNERLTIAALSFSNRQVSLRTTVTKLETRLRKSNVENQMLHEEMSLCLRRIAKLEAATPLLMNAPSNNYSARKTFDKEIQTEALSDSESVVLPPDANSRLDVENKKLKHLLAKLVVSLASESQV